MKRLTRFALALALAAAPGAASALDVLLTNDDGPNPGISAMRAALCAAGHSVTTVRPATNQSGRGGSLNTTALSSSGFMALTRVSSDACGVIYSLASPTAQYGGTPVDSLKAGLDVILVGNAPDLVVSGLNFGQNLGKPTSNSSGTVGAALQASLEGIPAIAGSVGLNLAENPTFPSTIASFADSAAFVVDVIAALEAAPGSALLPDKVRMLNINFPVPYASVSGIAITKLADRSELELPLFDVNLGFGALRPPNPSSPNCLALADGGVCNVGVGVQSVAGPDAERDADTDAYAAGLISITPMDGDMTAGNKGSNAVAGILGGLTP